MRANLAAGSKYWEHSFLVVFFLQCFPVVELKDFSQGLHLPPLRNLPQRRLHQPAALMAGEAEVDEPLAVEPAGHLLQDLDAPLAVLDQVVVGGEDAGDAALDGEGGTRKSKVRSLSRLKLS